VDARLGFVSVATTSNRRRQSRLDSPPPLTPGSSRKELGLGFGRGLKGEEWTPAALPYPIEQGQYGPIREYAACQWAQLQGMDVLYQEL